MRRFSRVGGAPETKVPPLTDSLRDLLNQCGYKEANSNSAQLSVPLLVLETMAAKVGITTRPFAVFVS